MLFRSLPYLIARQLHQARSWKRTLVYLRRAAAHPFEPIEAERIRLVADCHFRLAHWDDAAEAYRRYARLAPTSGEQARAEDWLQRITFLRTPGWSLTTRVSPSTEVTVIARWYAPGGTTSWVVIDKVPSGSGNETSVLGSLRVKVSLCEAGPVRVTVTVSTALVNWQLALLMPSKPVGDVPCFS